MALIDEIQEDSSFSFHNHINETLLSESGEEEDDDENYIEIALEPKPTSNEADFLQFRASFSVMLSGKSDFGMPVDSVASIGSETYPTSSDSSSLSSCSSSSSSAVLCRSNARRNMSGIVYINPLPAKSYEICQVEKDNKWRTAVQKLLVQRLMTMLMSSFRDSPVENSPSDQKTNNVAPKEDCSKVEKGKQSTVSKAVSYGLMELIIKFRMIKEKSMASLTRASVLISGSENTTYGCDKAVHHAEKLSYWCYQRPVEPVVGRHKRQRNRTSKLPEMSMDPVKRVIDSLTISSCPGSIKSSPIHNSYIATGTGSKPYTRENSIQAAIAHCKMSFTETEPLLQLQT